MQGYPKALVQFLADENFDNRIIRGLLQQCPDLDIVLVQDVGLRGAKDPQILEWAAQEQRVLLTHDVQTITKFAYERVAVGLPMPEVIETRENSPGGRVIEDILLLAELPEELQAQIRYVPL